MHVALRMSDILIFKGFSFNFFPFFDTFIFFVQPDARTAQLTRRGGIGVLPAGEN